MERYAVLLPNVQYQVVSTSATVMTIENNKTLLYIHPELIAASNSTKNCISCCGVEEKLVGKWVNLRKKRKTRQFPMSVHLGKCVEEITKNMKKWEVKKRRKDFDELSKRFNDEMIISMETCKRSLHLTEKYGKMFKQSKSEGKFNQSNHQYQPNTLFDFTKYFAYKGTPCL
jgi:hypothetical protein